MKRLVIPSQDNFFRPWIIHLRGLLTLLFLLLLVFFYYPNILSLAGRPSVLGFKTIEITPKSVVNLINQARISEGVYPLKVNPNLELAAQLKAKDMFSKDYWAHQSPTGTLPWHFIQASGYNYRTAGENLAKNFVDSRQLVAAWLRSPSHRQNILNPNYTDTGVAVVTGKLNGIQTDLVVEFFASPLAQSESRLVKNALAGGRMSNINQKGNQVNSLIFKRVFSLLIVAILFLALAGDYFLVEKKLPHRYHSYSRLHLIFLIFILAIIIGLGHQSGLIK